MEDETKRTCSEWLDVVIELTNSSIIKRRATWVSCQDDVESKIKLINSAISYCDDKEAPEVKEYLQYALDELKIDKE